MGERLESVKFSESSKKSFESVRDELEFNSLDEAARFLVHVYIAAKESGQLVITGGFPVFSKKSQ